MGVFGYSIVFSQPNNPSQKWLYNQIEKEKNNMAFPKKQTTTFGGRVISRMRHKGQNGWCCGEKKCTVHKDSFHTSFLDAVFCTWKNAPVQDVAKMLTTVKGVTLDDYERAEPEQLLGFLRRMFAINLVTLGKAHATTNRLIVEEEIKWLNYLQGLLSSPCGRIWYFLDDSIAMYKTVLAVTRN